jgi:hypothetical protein
VELCEKKPTRGADHALGEAGDWGDQTAVAADSTRVVSLMVGKRPYDQPLALGQEAPTRLRAGPLPALVTEAFASDESALLAVCGHRSPAKGRGRHPVTRWRQGLA